MNLISAKFLHNFTHNGLDFMKLVKGEVLNSFLLKYFPFSKLLNSCISANIYLAFFSTFDNLIYECVRKNIFSMIFW